MDSLLEKIDLKNLDKSNWKKVKFSDIAINVRETSKNPLKDGFTKAIGLGHIEPDNLNLLGYTDIAKEGTKFNKVFRKGQFLFGSRRAYLRQMARATFDGVCTANIMVFDIKDPNVINKQLFEFIIRSDSFINCAINTSEGSLFPNAKWKYIAEYEFLLPPKDQQAQLAKLLWAMDEVIESDIELQKSLEKTLESNIESEIHGIELKNKVIREVLEELSKKNELVKLSDLGELLKGKGIPKSAVVENGIPCVRYGELYTKHHRVIRKFHSFITEEEKLKSFQLKKNDVLFAGSGETITEIGKSAAFVNDIEAYAGSDTLLFRPYKMDGHYLGYLLNSQLVRQQLNKFGTGATVMHIYNSDLEKVKVPKIGLDNQIRIGEKLESIHESIRFIESKIKNSQSLQKSLINQVF